jgi:hypothetical protein
MGFLAEGERYEKLLEGLKEDLEKKK